MLIDLKTATAPLELSCDLCLVGSGAAGFALASEMAATSLNVVLVESGGMDHEPATQSLYEVEVSGLPHPGSIEGRFRVCGGSTTKWAGQALTLMPSDFERRSWVAHSGWPTSFDELLPFYERAARFLLLDRMNFDTDLFSALRTPPLAFDPQRLWYHFSKFSPQPSVRERHLPAIRASSRCTLLQHASLTNIVLESGCDRVRAVEVRSLEGRRATVRARSFVLCVGGIETARVLLSSNRQHPRGIGNDHDLVGRYFQDHVYGEVGWLKPANPRQALRWFNVFHNRGFRYHSRCSAAPQWQRQKHTLNASMIMVFPDLSAVQDLSDLGRALRRRRFTDAEYRQLRRSVRRPGTTLRTLWQRAVQGRTYIPGVSLRVCILCEQEPDPESRITLSDRTDALGIPRANVRWQLTDLTQSTMQQFAGMLRDEFQRAGVGEIQFDPWFCDGARVWKDDLSLWNGHLRDQYHHMGTARMDDSPRQGVVDRHCRVHGVANLYVASSAVFPTSGHSNPTFTILALCMRLADRLKQELS